MMCFAGVQFISQIVSMFGLCWCNVHGDLHYRNHEHWALRSESFTTIT